MFAIIFVCRTYSQYKNARQVVNQVRNNRANRNSFAIPNEDNLNRQPLIDGNFQANQNRLEDIRRRVIALELLESFLLRHNREEQIDFNMLRRMTPEEIQDMVPSECSICIDPLNQDPHEQLIYLPCNQNHVFHESCIITWLNENQVCPLCREVVTREAVEGYARNV